MKSDNDLVKRLVECRTDYDDALMPDRAEPIGCDCGMLREAGDEILSLRAEVEALKSADEESCAVVDMLARLLAEIAITLKGQQPDMTKWSYHNLPRLVSEMKGRAEKAEAALAECREDAERYRFIRDAPESWSESRGSLEWYLPDPIYAPMSLDAAIDAALRDIERVGD